MNNINTKHYTPSFQAYYKSSFSRQLENFISSGKGEKELVNSFKKVLEQKESNVLGQGAYGKVSKIDDYYVFKTYFDIKPEVNKVTINNNNKFRNIKNYYGGFVVKIGNIKLLRNVSGDRHNFVSMARSKSDGIAAYNYSLNEFSTLPQKAFDNLARDFDMLNNIHEPNLHYKFDTNNPNNFIKVGKSIRIVDEVDWVPNSKPNDIFSFLRIFIQQGGDSRLKKSILKKCLLASEKYKLPMDDIYQYMPSMMDNILEMAKINRPFGELYYKLSELRNSGLKENVRMQKAKEYIDML